MKKLPESLNELLRTYEKLRDPVTGCPWDRVQNFKSIADCTIEEAYEVVDAIEREDFSDLKSELGDLLFLIIFHAGMAEEKKKFNFKKIALFGIGPIALVGIGIGVGAFLFMPTQTPVEQVEELIEKKLQQAGQLPSSPSDDEAAGEPQKQYKDTPSTETFVTSYYTFPDNFTTNLKGSKAFLQISVGVSTQYDETVMENVELHQLALRSEILGAVSEFAVEEIEGKTGRDDLSARIKDAINVKLEELEGFGGVEGVFFTSFVLQ